MKRSIAFLTAAFLCVGPLTALASQGRPSSAGRPSSPPGAPSSPGRSSMPDRPSLPAAGKSSNPGSEKGATGSEHGKTMSDLLSQNTKLASKLQTLTGKDPQVACSGFKNLGECVAAAHVSSNLGISFDDLKNKLTGANTTSLGSAIHELNPNVNAKAESKKAKTQAKEDMRDSSS